MATVYKTEKGRDGLIYEGFCYRFDKRGADDTIYWRCADQRQCKGRIATEPDYSNVAVRSVHCHLANPDKAIIRGVKTTLRNRAASETTTIPTIFRQESAKLANTPVAAAMMPSYNAVKTTLNRERNASYPALPTDRASIVIPAQFQVCRLRQ